MALCVHTVSQYWLECDRCHLFSPRCQDLDALLHQSRREGWTEVIDGRHPERVLLCRVCAAMVRLERGEDTPCAW